MIYIYIHLYVYVDKIICYIFYSWLEFDIGKLKLNMINVMNEIDKFLQEVECWILLSFLQSVLCVTSGYFSESNIRGSPNMICCFFPCFTDIAHCLLRLILEEYSSFLFQAYHFLSIALPMQNSKRSNCNNTNKCFNAYLVTVLSS